MKPQLSIEAFADWCEKQPAGDEYDYDRPGDCACAQYQKSLGIHKAGWLYKAHKYGGFWLVADNLANENPRTFGALASRLRAAS